MFRKDDTITRCIAALNSEQLSVLEAVSGRIPRIRTPLFYSFALFVVAIVMVLLIAAYLALLAAIGYLMVQHAIKNVHLLSDGESLRRIIGFYLGPLIFGGGMLAALVKPLFAPPGEARIHPRRLKPEDEPLLFAFVAQVSKAINAPQPRVIQVDADINASAGFGRGVMGFLRGGVVLTLGMPLAAALNLQGLAGVIAHELGHFNQGVGIRLVNLVGGISRWFARVVYERDRWDVQLERERRTSDSIVAIVAIIVIQVAVWCMRRVLWVLMVIGNVASCFLLRQAEFDADLREIHFAGSEAFRRTFRELRLLNMARLAALQDLNDAWRARRLGDDFAEMVMHRRKPLDEEKEGGAPAAERPAGRRRMFGLMDTHPSDKARMARSRAVNAEGLFQDQRPASVLFADFPALCRVISQDFYVEQIGAAFAPESLIPSERIAELQREKDQAADALQRFTFNYFTPIRPLLEWGEYLTPPEDGLECARELRRTREKLEELSRTVGVSYEQYSIAWRRHMNGHWLNALRKAECRTTGRDFDVPMQGAADPEQFLIQTQQEKQALSPALDAFETELRKRLIAALRLLWTPQVLQRFPEGEALRPGLQPVIDALSGLGSVRSQFEDVMGVHFELKALLHEFRDGRKDERIARRIMATRGKLHRITMDLFKCLTPVKYPYDHGKGQVTMAHYSLNPLPSAEDVGELYAAISLMIDKLLQFQMDATAHLAHAAERVEGVLGMRPMHTDQMRSGKFDY